MQVSVVLVLLVCFPAMFCFTLHIEEDFQDDHVNEFVEIGHSNVAEFLTGDLLVSDDVQMATCTGRKCKCCKHGCYCVRRDRRSKISVGAVIMLADADDTSSPKISAKFMIGVGALSFEKEFPFDRTEDVCKVMQGTNYCFKFEVELSDRKLNGGVWMSKPKRFQLGCFSLPL